MAKKVNITDKLELGGNPCLVIGNTELEVNADAATVLKIMDKYKDTDANNTSVDEMMGMYELIFPEKSRDVITKLNLSFSDFQIVIEEAMNLITGEEENDTGEAQTHTTT